MEELKEAESPAVLPEVSPAAAETRRFALPALSRRTLILAVAGVLALLLAGGGTFAYRAGAEKKRLAVEAAAEVKRQKAADAAAERAAMSRLAAEVRRSHDEIMAASPPASEIVRPAPPAVPARVAPAVPPASAAPAKPATVPVDEKPTTVMAEAAPPPLPRGSARRVPKKALAAAPAPSGSCALNGKSAEDYGKALGRCLEEYSRIEGAPR